MAESNKMKGMPVRFTYYRYLHPLVKHIWMEHWILKEISIMDYNNQKTTFLKK